MTQQVNFEANAIERLQAAIVAFGAPRVEEASDHQLAEGIIRNSMVLNAIMEEFIHYVYIPNLDGNGYLCLTASGSFKRGVKPPWVYSNTSTTRSEKKLLRSRFNQCVRNNHARLFIYNKYKRTWFTNIDQYTTLEKALKWWDYYKIPTRVNK